MERFTDKLRSIKNENDLYKISISEPINDLIMYLSFVSRAINIKSAKIIFLYDHLKSLVKRKLFLNQADIEFLEPEIYVNHILEINKIELNLCHLNPSPSLRCKSWDEDERDSIFAYHLERVETIGGGTCLLNSILLGLSPLLQRLPYIDDYQYIDNRNPSIDYYKIREEDIRIRYGIQYNISFLKKNDMFHICRYLREYIGNLYRKFLFDINDNDKIFIKTERNSLYYNKEGNFNLKNNFNPDLISTFYSVGFLNIDIAYKLLLKLGYNLIVISRTITKNQKTQEENIFKSINNSPFNKPQNDRYIIIFGSNFHFELVKIKNTNKTIYTRNELEILNIFNKEIFNNEYGEIRTLTYDNLIFT